MDENFEFRIPDTVVSCVFFFSVSTDLQLVESTKKHSTNTTNNILNEENEGEIRINPAILRRKKKEGKNIGRCFFTGMKNHAKVMILSELIYFIKTLGKIFIQNFAKELEHTAR